MASDSASIAHLLALFPQLDSELDSALKDAVGRIPASSFQRSKERVIIAEFFFHKSPDLSASDRRKLVDLIEDAGDAKELKARLKVWESPTAGGLSSLWSGLTSLFKPKETTSDITEAARKSKDTNDREFLVALEEKVSKEPLLEQLAQDVVKEAHTHLQGFIRSRLQRLHSRAYDIKRGRMHHQVEVEVNDQDQKRRALLREEWFDEVKMAQAQVAPGYVYVIYRYVQHHPSVFYRPQDVVFIYNVEEVKHKWGSSSSKSPNRRS